MFLPSGHCVFSLQTSGVLMFLLGGVWRLCGKQKLLEQNTTRLHGDKLLWDQMVKVRQTGNVVTQEHVSNS